MDIHQNHRPEHRPAPSRRTVLRAAVGLAGTAVLTPALGAPAVAAPSLVSFSSLNGTPVYYGLETSARTWYATSAFKDACDQWMATLKLWSQNAGYGAVSNVGSAGFYVDKAGQHGAGTAMDLSVVRWSTGQVSSMLAGDHDSSDAATRRRYYGVAASLRVHFRYVLDGYYDAAHRNHFHADFAGLPYRRLLRSSRADTVFCQAVCNTFMSSGLAIDGVWGSRTTSAVATLASRLGVSGDLQTDQAAVLDLLRGIAAAGFGNRAI